jgi:hypothetical protein
MLPSHFPKITTATTATATTNMSSPSYVYQALSDRGVLLRHYTQVHPPPHTLSSRSRTRVSHHGMAQWRPPQARF